MDIVIAHPNGWGIREQAFLRTSSVVAGFTFAEHALDRVHFVTEAEASLCTIFAVCDAGGSTVDTTVYAVEKAHPKLQLSETRASACSIFVDKLAEDFLRQYFESRELPWEEVDEYVATGIHNFESKEKRKFGGDGVEISLGVAGYRCKKLELGIRHGELKLPRRLKAQLDPGGCQVISTTEAT
ncbi:hypothetical protein FRC11_008301 [Ceratobasidium sp. 423]|nr:hypothetical protein FRC11_008301 [Ceratobasidium sp. 423]